MISRSSELEAGLIYVRFEDPVSQWVMALTHYDYSAIGFYWPSIFTGKHELSVILIDAFRMQSPSWIPPQGITLEELRHRPEVSRLARRRLQPMMRGDSVDHDATRKLLSQVRTGVATVMTRLTELPLASAVDRLLSGISPFDEILKLFRFDNVTFDRPQELVVQNQGSVNFDPTELRSILEIILSSPHRYQRFIDRLSLPVSMVPPVTTSPKSQEKLIENLCHSSSHLIQTLSQAMVSGNLNFDALRELVDHTNRLFDQAGTSLGSPIPHVSLPRLEADRNVSVRSTGEAHLDLEPFHEFVTTLVTSVQRGTPLTLHLNDLIDLHNQLTQPKLPRLTGEMSYPAIVVVSTASPIPITLSSGNQVTLASKGADLSQLTLDQLKEIASILNELDTDGRFETLRTDVARRLAQLRST
jgi:hypothetical protein